MSARSQRQAISNSLRAKARSGKMQARNNKGNYGNLNMGMFQRSRSFSFNPFGYATQRAPQATLQKQVRALIAAKKKDAQDVTRDRTGVTTTASTCLTAAEAFVGTANSGILAADADEILVNSVRLKGYHEILAALDVNTDGNRDTFVRHLIVWFYKPLLVASAGGTLPPITEVLISDELHSLPVTAAANGGRFVVLSDKMWNLGTNTYQAITAAGSAINTGKSKQYFDYTVKVGKTVKCVAPSLAGTAANQAGHYDLDSAAGQVDRGLLVLYSQVYVGASTTVVNTVLDTRANYTG